MENVNAVIAKNQAIKNLKKVIEYTKTQKKSYNNISLICQNESYVCCWVNIIEKTCIDSKQISLTNLQYNNIVN